MKPDNDDARQALEAILRDTRGGMSDAEVNEVVSRELDKGEEMDADLISEALCEAPEEGQKEANWTAIERRLGAFREKAPSALKRRAWVRAAAAVLVVLTLVSVGTATNAFRWDSLVTVFRPFAEYLGIHLAVEDLGSAGTVEKVMGKSTDLVAETISQSIRDVQQVPESLHGYPSVPSWIPRGYAFKYAEVFYDSTESSLLIGYTNGDTELFVQTITYDKATTRTAINVVEKDVAEGQKVAQATITENEGIVNATREDDLACYMVWGRLSREDISAVIASIK